MEWIERFNQVIDYIELHILEDLQEDEIEKIVGCSFYYFQRMFAYMTNISLHEYIRRRRMSLAAVELQGSHKKIIDIAFQYGYESPTAFNRAFQNIHHIPPSYVRKKNVSIKSYPPIKFHLSIQGHDAFNFKVEHKNSFRIIGISCPLSHHLEENFQTIPHQWNQALYDRTLNKLAQFNNTQPLGLLGVSIHHTHHWKYMIAVSSTKEIQDFEEYIIPTSYWAIFQGEGTNTSLQELEKRVITEWLPTSGYEYANIPDIEVYRQADPQHAIYEYWLPVRKKEKNHD